MVNEQTLRHYLPMVHWHLRWHGGGSGEREDLLQEGVLAILEELQNEAPDEELRVRRAIGRRLRQLSRAGVTRRSKELHSTQEDGSLMIEETVATADNCLPVIGECWVEWLVGHLRGRQRECVDLYFREGLTQQEIGVHLGIPQQTVSQAISGGIRNLRKLYQQSERTS